MHDFIRTLALVAVPFLLLACTDSAKLSEQKAAIHAERLAKLADDDVTEVRQGVPRGAKALGALWEKKAPTLVDHDAVYRKMEQVRGDDPSLRVAKSTFFALTDDKGVVLSSDQDPDILKGKNLVQAYPALSKVAGGEVVETTGSMPETAHKPNAADLEWLVAAPIPDATGAVRGMYASGWSMKRLCYHLEETLKHDFLTEAIQTKKDRFKLPLVYVFVFDGAATFAAPVTPDINRTTIEKLDLSAKTAAGVYHQVIEITGRSYGLAAARAPKMGSCAGVAVLRSEL
jgi:hypothetical protein